MHLPHSILKKRNQANNYHRVCEAVAAGIASFVHCDTKHNLADIGTKALYGPMHQFLLKNQHFSPVLTAGECKVEADQPTKNSAKARLILSMMLSLDDDVVGTFLDTGFKFHLLQTKQEIFCNSMRDSSSGLE